MDICLHSSSPSTPQGYSLSAQTGGWEGAWSVFRVWTMEHGRSRDWPWGEVARREKPDSDSHGYSGTCPQTSESLQPQRLLSVHSNCSGYALRDAARSRTNPGRSTVNRTPGALMTHGLGSYLLLSGPANSSPRILKIGQRWDDEGS